MRHSRSEEFDRPLRRARSDVRRWTELSDDPNAAEALAHRADVLRTAWRPPIKDRIEFLEGRCAGKRVLDIGCVAHDLARMDSPLWLHGRLATVASRCVGVDVLAAGVEQMRARGFEAFEHDLRRGLGPLVAEPPFDVIVAGELIEHVESVDTLFRTACALLSPRGELIVTTPNPYSPSRVRAAQLGIVWENADHIFYAFPSGMAELAERHGLVLVQARVTAVVPALDWKAVVARARGRAWRSVGYTSIGRPRVRAVRPWQMSAVMHRVLRPRSNFVGETFVYVIGRPPWRA